MKEYFDYLNSAGPIMEECKIERIVRLESTMQMHTDQIHATNATLEHIVTSLRGIQDQTLQVKWSVIGGCVALAVLSKDSPLGSLLTSLIGTFS